MRVIDADAYVVHIEKALHAFIDKLGSRVFEDASLYVVEVLGGVLSDLRDERITPTIDVEGERRKTDGK